MEQNHHQPIQQPVIPPPIPVTGGEFTVSEYTPIIGVNATDADVSVSKKRGRPPKGTVRVHAPVVKKPKDEEDVCFICFDGGSLVLCDHRLVQKKNLVFFFM